MAIVFMGIFYAVVLVVTATLAVSGARAWRDVRTHREQAISWQTSFPDLPARDRVCRHVFTGEFKQRICVRAFDCRDCQQHAALVAQRAAEPAPASERYYHRGHAWAQVQPDGAVTVGLDDLGARMLAHAESVELPAIGAHVEVNGAAWKMRKRGADVRILSPLDGEVLATGSGAEGWYLKVRPDSGKLDTRHLLSGAEIRPWMTHEVERLAGAGATLADGGVLLDDLSTAYSDADWGTVCGEVFLQV